MRSRSSSNHNSRSMEVERPKPKEEPQLSGAYIRSLVKQLSSSRPKEPATPKSTHEVIGDGFSQDPDKLKEAQQHSPQQPQPPPQPPKKQVRRRLHTTRPYQERLLNMAEARREIVTALKYHRAAMKQASEQQQHQQQNPPSLPQLSPPPFEDPNSRIYQPNSNFPNYFQTPPLSSFTYPWAYNPYPSTAPLPISDNLNPPLPNQPLGLNLSFQGFNNIQTPFCNTNDNNPSSSSTSYSYSSLPISDVAPQAPEVTPDPTLHPMMDDEEMAEIRSIVEQHDMEWNDTMNLVASARWSKFLETMEVGHGEKGGDGFHVFDEFMDIPTWLNDGSGGLQCFDDYQMEDYLQGGALPCLDIGEIEGLDGDWLS